MTSPDTREQNPRANEIILVVDDDVDFVNLMSMMLTDLGFEVHTALDPQHAVDLVSSTELEIDLILLDMVMPGMNGVEALPILSSRAPGAKILFFSGMEPSTEVQDLVASGDAGFVLKGSPAKDLYAVIEAMLPP